MTPHPALRATFSRKGRRVWLGIAFSACATMAWADDAHVRATILPGSPPPTPVASHPAAKPGDVTLNFPSADANETAQAILTGILGYRFTPDPSVHASVSVVTVQPVALASVLPTLEDALKAANLGLVLQNGAYTLVPLSDAHGRLIGPNDAGYGDETIALHFVSAAELKKLLDPIVPNTISQADAARNILVVTGTTGQRTAVRDLVRQFDVNWLQGMSFGLFVPQHTDARLITPELDKLLNQEGAPTAGLVRLIAMERLNGILAISSQPQYLGDVQRWIEILDREGESSERRLFVYRVQNGRSQDLSRVLVGAFGGTTASGGQPTGGATPTSNGSSAAVQIRPSEPAQPLPGAPQTPTAQPIAAVGSATITSDDTNNAIVVFSTPGEYAVIEDALRKLDVPPLQVVIEAAITEVTLTDQLRFGVQWFLKAGQAKFGFSEGTTAAPTQEFPGFSLAYANGVGSIQATLNALSKITDVKVLSSPKLMVLNNQTASLEVGDQVPVATQSAVSTVNTDAPIVNAIEYRDTGVILKVTPRVNSGGLVLLDISQEVSDVTETDSSKLNSPTIQQRKFTSSVAVQDGQTIAMGGLIRDGVTKGSSRLPGLGRIPLVGALFGDTDNTHKRTELLVLLTPRVIRNADDARAVTDELREKIKAAAPLPPRPGRP